MDAKSDPHLRVTVPASATAVDNPPIRIRRLRDLLDHTAGIRHLSFDLWCTLIRSGPDYKHRRSMLLREHFGLLQPPEAVRQAVRRWDLKSDALNQVTGLNIDAVEIYALVLLDLGMEPRSIGPGELAAFYQRTEELFLSCMPVLIEPDAVDQLVALRERGLTISLLSNTGFIRGPTVRVALERLGLGSVFGAQIYSDEIRASKPAREAFDAVWTEAQRQGCSTRDEVLHIGDNRLADVQGSLTHGFRAAWFDDDA